nr:reverse transcriptase domain-containing protein [Tanacetum cinerariifolium]
MVWKASLNRLATCSNLMACGISLPTYNFPFCGLDIEDIDHVLFSCQKVCGIWRKVWSWWSLHPPASFSLFHAIESTSGNANIHGDANLSKATNEVTDMTKVDKIEVKWTKPGTRMKRVQEIEDEGKFISNLIPLIIYPNKTPKSIAPLVLIKFTLNLEGKPNLEGLSRPHQLILDKLELVDYLQRAFYKTCLCKGNCEPSSLFDFEEVMNNNHNQEPPPQNGPPPMVRPNGQAPRTMEELCQPSINGRGRPIAPIPIQATDFGLRRHMIQQVKNTCQFHGLPGDDANRHFDKFLEITQHMKQNGVFDDALRLSLFPYSLMHHDIAWYDRLPRNSIYSFDDMMRKFLSKYFPPSMVTKLKNEITKFEQKPHESLFEAWERYKLSIDWCPNHNMLLVTQIDTFYNGSTLSHRDTINVAAGGTFMQKTPEECYELIENMTAHHNHWDTSAI